MKTLEHRFVEFIPEEIEHGVLYVTIPFKSAVHSCACGCGKRVVTPLTPNDWKLTFDGKSVSLHPSIGNWNFPCKSHYWIRKNVIEDCARWSQMEINSARRKDRKEKKKHFRWLTKKK
jgi:hypothetical protein